MVVDQIKQIDKNADNQIDGKELVDALKPNGFFSKEENLTKVGDLLNSKDIEQSDQTLFSSLEQSFYALKGDIFGKERITNEDKNFLEVYKKVLGGKYEEQCREIQKVIDRHNVQKIMEKDPVSLEDICILQDYLLKPYEEILDLGKRIKIENFIEWYDIQNLMQECKKKGNMTKSEEVKLILYLEKLIGEDCDSKDLDTQKKIDEVEKILSQQNDIIQGIKDVYKTLDQNEQNLLTGILGPGNKDLIENIDNFLSGDIQLDTEDAIKGVNVLNKLIEQDLYRHGKLEKIVNKSVLDISHEANKKIAEKGTGNKNRYSGTEIMAIQLWANVCYGENLIINGIRGEEVYRPMKDISSEEGITSTYIYRLELTTRSDVITIRHNNINTRVDDLLDIPNLHDMLDVVQPKQKQDEIRQDFLNTVYLPIRQSGIYFENKITGEKLSELLQNMINAEIFKDQSIYETIFMLELSKSRMDENSQEYKECELLIEEFKKLQLNDIQTLGEYYSELVKQGKEQIIGEHGHNKSENEAQLLNNALNTILKQIDGLPKLKNNPSESEISQYKINYKKEYQKIANNFIELWRDKKYRKYLENSVLTTQIFIEIYSLWKDDGIDKVFGPDIKQSVDKFVNQLNGYTDIENNEIERICDLYYNTMDAETNIKEGRSERGERHYTDENMHFDYYPAIDNTAMNVGDRRPAGYVEVTSTVHHDDYFGNGYSENYGTVTRRRESPSPRNPKGSDEVLVNHDPNGTLVGPDKDGWYAILPQELKDKSNKGQIKLSIIGGKPCVHEFMENGDIKYWVYDTKKRKLVFDKTLTKDEYLRVLTIESSRMKVWEADHGEEFQKIQRDMKDIIDKNKAIYNFFKEYENQDLDGNELKLLQKGSVQFYEMVCDIASPQVKSKLQSMKSDLQKLNQNSNGYENPHERQIKELIDNIDSILSFATEDQVKKAKAFKELCTNTGKVHENDNWYDHTRQERVTIAVSFVVAIGMTILAIGTFGLGSPLAAGGWLGFAAALGISAIAAGSAMVASELTQVALNKRSGGGTMIVDGKEYHLDYNNPTLLQEALDPNSKITWRDAVKGYGTQFLTQTLLQAFLMRGGAEVSNFISKLVLKAPAGSFAQRSSNFVCKILCKERISTDAYTEQLISSAEKQVCKEGFMKQFSRELLEETWEEGVEQAAEGQGAILGAVATIIHCLKPKPGAALNITGISQNPDIELPAGQNKMIVNSTYDGTDPENVNMLKNYYESIPGYTVTMLEGDVLKVTIHGVSNGDETIIDSKKDIEIEFRPSKAPLSIRSMPKELLKIGGINVDDQTGNITYKSEVDLLILSEYYRQNNLGIIKINQDGTAEIITKKETIQLNKSREYFNGQSHKFNVTEGEAIYYSKKMDGYLSQIQENGENLSTILTQLREDINTEYKMVTGTDQNLDLTDEQLLSVLDAHEQDGVLGELTIGQLRQKVKILAETITDSNTRRFLLEAGFCGSQKLGTDHTGDIAKITQKNINDLLDGKTELKISEMTVNDLGILMRKSANIGLDAKTLQDVRTKINERIEAIKKSGKYSIESINILENNIEQISFEFEIRNIEINDPNFESKVNEIKERINNKFGESKIGQELAVELDKKNFEFYKANGDLDSAKSAIENIENINNELLSEDITNFRYKRGLLDVELYKIQLGEGDINIMNKTAEELREDTETIGGRTDINTLLSKIEAGILLGKPQEELDAYLSFLAIQENDAGVNVLGAVISTISNTFPSQELDDSVKRIGDAGKASDNADLKQKGDRAREIAENYKTMKQNLEGDKNGVERKKLQDIIDKFVYERPINTITDIGNTFTHPLKLFNYGTVASIEISENTYSKTREILTGNSDINGVKMGEIDMEGNWELTPEGFREYMIKINEEFDGFIRTLYSTEKLQELNSAHHSAVYDANMESYLAEVGLNDLAQVVEIYGIADCRVHAFTKQILFDTMKITQLQNLQKNLNSETDPATRERIEKQIKILKNTKMVYIDSAFSGKVRMKGKYQAEKENGHLIGSNEDAIIEEHTYNLIEIPSINDDGNITGKNVFYADAFYQGIKENGNNTGKVYDLSFNPDAPITTIYGKTYYTKKNGKYVHDPKVNMYMTSEVIGSDGNVIPITTVPLFRSVKGRGESLTPSNVQTQVLSGDEVAARNEETRAHVEAIDRINIARSEMMRTMKETLESGDIQKIENILVNGIGTAMHFNVETGTRETGTGITKITETQAEYLRRAIRICENYNGNIPTNMQQALNNMLNNIVTQDEVNYRLKSGQATDVDERMGVFWENILVFNEVYKSKVDEALEKVKANPSTKNIEELQKAIKAYQEIYDGDMKKFFEQNQETMLQENERNETYHRNNFEHVAKRFRSDMELYAGIVKSLENNGLYEQAFEIRQYMIDQCNTLLGHSDKLLGHMIDFKKVKKEMKGIEGREIYIQLLEFRAKGIGNVDAELKKRGIDPKKIKEMVGVDTSKPFNSKTLSEAISNIEESGLKEYYDIIALVFNPDILAINIENSVYSKGGYKVGDVFNTETTEDYVARKYAEAEIVRQIDENTDSGKIGQIISSQILDKIDSSLLTGKSKPAIQAEIQHLADLCIDAKLTGIDTYNICKKATEALIFQTAESQTRIMGDHGINHISGNIFKLNTYLDAGVRGGKIPANEVGKYKLMGALTHIFHDIGYAATISKGSGSFDGSAIHPFTSKSFFDSNIKPLLEGTGLEAESNLISQSIEAHDGTRLDFSTPETTFLSMVNLSDNMALGVDKMAQLWSNPKLLNHIATLYALNAAGIELKESNKIIAENIRKDTSITPAEQESLISAVNELSGRGLDNIDFWSISPLTAMEFSGDVPTLSMYKGANLMLVAEVCGIRMETEYDENGNIAVDDKGRKKIGLKDAIETKNRDAIISLIKGTKFCSQIVKPLGDYADNYQIMDSNGHEYPKTNGKYNMDEIKADLLLGNSVSLNDGKRTVLNYKYESATDESILAEKNSVYGHIDTAEMLGKGVEAMKRLNTTAIIDELGSLNKTTKGILDKIKNTESIDTKEIIESIDKTMNTLKDALSGGDVTVNSDFESRFKHFQEDITLFKTYVNENKYSELKVTTETIQEEIAMLSSLLVKE